MLVLLLAISFATLHAQNSRDEARRKVLYQEKHYSSTQQGRTINYNRNGIYGHVYKNRKKKYYDDRNNSGKHLGWYKEKGNPHRYNYNADRKGQNWKHEKHDD